MALRALGSRLLARSLYAGNQQQLQQSRGITDFFKKVQVEVDSNPELKRGMNAIKEAAESVKEKSKVAGEQAQKAAAAAQNAAEEFTKKAAQATGTVQEAVSHASKGLRDSFQESSSSSSSSQKASASGSGSSSSSSGDANGRQAAGAAKEDGDAGGGAGAASGGAEEKAKASKIKDVQGRLQHAASLVWREVREAVSPTDQVNSVLRAPPAASEEQPARDGGVGAYDGPSNLQVLKQKEPAWKKHWREVSEKLGSHPLFSRLGVLRQHKFVEKGREVATDLGDRTREVAGGIKDRWENSDSPLVHRIQDMSDSMFAESEAARCMREIRSRDADFDLLVFLRRLKGDVTTVVKAYLTGQEEVLREHCSPETVERLMGIVRAMQAQGIHSDPTILDSSDVELVDLKFLEDQPVVVVQFNLQQINCSRDKFGNVVEGAPDSVHRVFYYWALQQDESGYLGSDGKWHPPRWMLKEMLVRGMHNLL